MPQKPQDTASHSPASVQHVEAESGHSAKTDEQHKALEHNVHTGRNQRHPEEVPAQHATGSFTGGGGPGKR
ncbi:hypothetical protein [Silvibacterium dinghuense]|uniref:Uncharacterized protein n=1 Tax=Silvibacterium dinghuense TaxID=1560006 RepID=A0A4Q1SII5_9BACT|nr:hypothetical protein [Silvibacterium dinghuense]RXS97421.1 hypothetical protein ESZ00_05860 [Silvibacterium dinghuense]GGG98883.1 hypothetical protein GCM10011586_12950 [Silvibacterium dinghuense]